MKKLLLIILLLPGLSLFAQKDYSVLLKTGKVFFPENRTEIPNELSPKAQFNQRIYKFIQFYEIPSQKIQSDLAALDIQLLEYIPNNTYIASIPFGFDISRLEEFNIRAVVNIDSKYKIAPSVSEIISISKDTKSYIEVVLNTFNDIPLHLVSQSLSAMKIRIVERYQNSPFIICKLHIDQIEELSVQRFTSFIEKPSPPGTKEDQGARALHRSSTIDNQIPGGLRYDGNGVNVCVRDDGKIGPHIDFKGRLDQSLCYSNVNYATHGDMVSGVLVGAGNLDPDVTGTAKGAFLYMLEYEAGFMDETLMLHKDKNVTITNSSYSDGCNDGYTVNAYNVDKQLLDNPQLMHVFSAGNMGNSDCNYGAGTQWGNITGGHKIGKNSITVGNVNELGVIEKSSSKGPATDGRIKPDLCAQGTNQKSTFPNNVINFGGGSSASCPGVSGVLAQLTQVYKELNNNINPPAALLKASVLNTATDIENPGPDFQSGWGIVNAYRAYKLISGGNYLSDQLAQGQNNNTSIVVPTGTKRLNIMLYWTDEPASVLSSKSLVNDLDLVVKDNTNNQYLPWILDATPNADSLNKTATKGQDHLNNMEQVSIDKPVAGNYNLDVSAFTVPFGSQSYWIVYEIIPDTPKLVFPIGGESFTTKELLNIQWDAAGDEGEFTLDYSLNGQNWTFIKKVNGAERRAYWQTLAVPTEKVWLRISRNGFSDVMVQPYTIIKRVDSLKVDRICPDFVDLSWEKLDSASSYILYELGEKYMEPVLTVNNTFTSYALSDPGKEHWFAVQPVWKSGVKGKRSIAVKVQNLKNCKQAVDLALHPSGLLEINGVYCENEIIPVSILISNEGINTITNFSINVTQSGVGSKIINFNQVLTPGLTITVPIDTLIASQSTAVTYTFVINTPGESAFFNDTLSLIYHLQVQPSEGFPIPVVEGFEGQNFPPDYWQVIDTLFDIKWDRIECTGSDGLPTKAAWVNNFSNPASGTYDDMITARYNLENESQSWLLFDLSYAVFDPNSSQDSLAIDVSTDCGKTFPYRIYHNGGETMQTAGVHDELFIPGKASDWGLVVIPLTQFSGQNLSFRFRNITAYGNSLFIDNVKIVNELKNVSHIIEYDSIACIEQQVEFYAQSSPDGVFIWEFGPGAEPEVALGQGPHLISYTIPGVKHVKLTVSNSFGQDTSSIDLLVEPIPDAQFTFAQTGNTYLFGSLSTFATWIHFWDFGDGTFSNEVNPSHTYSGSGNFTVKHSVSGYCGEQTSTQKIILTSVNEAKSNVNVYPNPAKSIVTIQSDRIIKMIEITDVKGQEVFEEKSGLNTNSFNLDISNLTRGIYLLKVWNESDFKFLKLIVL